MVSTRKTAPFFSSVSGRKADQQEQTSLFQCPSSQDNIAKKKRRRRKKKMENELHRLMITGHKGKKHRNALLETEKS